MQTQLSDTRIIRNFNKHYIHNFQMKLSCEIWDTIFGVNDVNKIFSNFHYTFLRKAFPKRKCTFKKKKKRLYLDDKRYKDIHKPQKGTIFE